MAPWITVQSQACGSIMACAESSREAMVDKTR